MRKLIILFATTVVLAPPVCCQQSQVTGSENHITMRLWPGTAPGASSVAPAAETTTFPADAWVAGRSVTILGNVSEPTLTLYPPPSRTDAPKNELPDQAPAVVVFPGGGYYVLAYDLEGTEVCNWLNQIHIACVLVKYRVPNTGPYPKSSQALADAQRAIGIVRQHATGWNIDPGRIGAVGFSAGGHLVATLASNFAGRVYPQTDPADKESCRPDFVMLIYPAYLFVSDGSLELSSVVRPNSSTPPAFIVQAEDDPVHIENALAYFAGLKQVGVPAEMHLYSKGGHGYGLRRSDNPVTGWPGEAQKWLQSIHVLPGAQIEVKLAIVTRQGVP